jgi:hypothetical protein
VIREDAAGLVRRQQWAHGQGLSLRIGRKNDFHSGFYSQSGQKARDEPVARRSSPPPDGGGGRPSRALPRFPSRQAPAALTAPGPACRGQLNTRPLTPSRCRAGVGERRNPSRSRRNRETGGRRWFVFLLKASVGGSEARAECRRIVTCRLGGSGLRLTVVLRWI